MSGCERCGEKTDPDEMCRSCFMAATAAILLRGVA